MLCDDLPGFTFDEACEWLRGYLRREVQRQRIERGEAWERLGWVLGARVNGRRGTAALGLMLAAE